MSVCLCASESGFNLEKAVKQTATAIQDANRLLCELEGLLHSTQAVCAQGHSQWDLLLLPKLRTLSCVAGIAFPPQVRAYLEGNFSGLQPQLFFDVAVGRVPYARAHADPYVQIRGRASSS